MKPEDILKKPKYNKLKNLTLICKAMEEYYEEKTSECEHEFTKHGKCLSCKTMI